jgi:HD-GYP domain-containing protein (c-di-GMP phosphodiesterase class II)
MLKDIPYLIPAIPAVRHHHERWDGKGYPDGLAGYDIPLSARIVAVADTLDALTTNRPYRQALNTDHVYQHIVGNAGTYYDPEIIRVFRKLWGEGKITVNMAV